MVFAPFTEVDVTIFEYENGSEESESVTLFKTVVVFVIPFMVSL